MQITKSLTRPVPFLVTAGVSLVLHFTAAGQACAGGIHPVTGEELSENQSFTYQLSSQFPSLDPQLSRDAHGYTVIRDLFEGLLNQDSNGELVPGVAKHYSVSDDRTTYVFTLRQAARWSNGDPVTAHDFVYAWRRAVDPVTASPYGWYVESAGIVNARPILTGELPPAALGVTAVDDHTLEVRLETPLPWFPAMTTYATLFPAHRTTIEANGANWTTPGTIVSNGAYTLEELVPNAYHTRVRNPHYWDARNAIIEKVTGVIIEDENEALARYRAGEFDLLTTVPKGRFPELAREMPQDATIVPRLCTIYLVINHGGNSNPSLHDVRVRKALSLAIDRAAIIADMQRADVPAFNLVHPSTAGFRTPEFAHASLSQFDRDAEAKRLIGKSKAGKATLRFVHTFSEHNRHVAGMVGEMWDEKLGILTELAEFEWAAYLGVLDSQAFDVALIGWCGDYNEASTFLNIMTTDNGSNFGKFSNARVDELMKKSRTAENPEVIYAEVEQVLVENAAFIPMWHANSSFFLKGNIKGWPYGNVEGNWYAKDLYRIED